MVDLKSKINGAIYIALIILIGSMSFGLYKTLQSNAILSAEIEDHEDLQKELHSLRKKEVENAAKTKEAELRLLDAQQKYEADIVNIRTEFANSLHEQAERAEYYRNLAYERTPRPDRVNELLAEFDRIIVEGRQLVKEFAASTRLRDSQVKALIIKIKADQAITHE